MKGIVFTEFIEMVENTFGDEVVDEIIDGCDLPSGGAYTAVGTYSFSEMADLLGALSTRVSMSPEDLQRAYGKHLFSVFVNKYAVLLQNMHSSFDLLLRIDDHIHVEVKKLYPDAELPKFGCKKIDENTLELVYSSDRKLWPLAEGLIKSTMEHFKEEGSVSVEMLSSDGAKVKFKIERK